MNNSYRLMLACARTEISVEDAAQIRALADPALDWEALISAAVTHRVMPLLYLNLSDICPERVPADSMAYLQDHHYVHLLRSNMLATELLKLLRSFAANGLKVIPYKGPTMAMAAYGDLALRQFGDLDLLIGEQDIKFARDLLEQAGYRCVWSSSWEMHLMRQDDLVGVDLHWAFSRIRFAFPLHIDELWPRRQEVLLNGESVFTMNAEDLLLVRCDDASKDFWKEDWPRLHHICDVAELIRARPELDWDALLARASRLRARGSLLLFLALAVNLLDARVPARVQRQIAGDPQMEALLQLAQGRLAPASEQEEAQEGGDLLARHMFCLRLKEFVPLPPAVAFKLLYALAGLYYWPSGNWISRFRYWLSDRRPRSL